MRGGGRILPMMRREALRPSPYRPITVLLSATVSRCLFWRFYCFLLVKWKEGTEISNGWVFVNDFRRSIKCKTKNFSSCLSELLYHLKAAEPRVYLARFLCRKTRCLWTSTNNLKLQARVRGSCSAPPTEIKKLKMRKLWCASDSTDPHTEKWDEAAGNGIVFRSLRRSGRTTVNQPFQMS